MSTITFNNWDKGLDLRKAPSTSDANRLRALTNAYVTEGKTLRKRPGLRKVADLTPGTIGLFPGLGALNTFSYAAVTHPASPGISIQHRRLDLPPGGSNVAVVHSCDTFNGFLYVVVFDGSIGFRHHYIDGANTFVGAAPFSHIVAKAASKIWSPDSFAGDTVKFSATNNPRNWTLANDAGFLPVGLQQRGSRNVTAIGNYQNRLVVFFADSAQVWQVDPNPALHQFLQSVDIGTTRPYSHQNMNTDVIFHSTAGVKSITKQVQTENLIDADIGSPIDAAIAKGVFDLVMPYASRAQFVRSTGQYWLYVNQSVVAFTFSRTSKISAWSYYKFPFTLDYIAELDGELYIRSENSVYILDPDVFTDAGTTIAVEIETAYADFKLPGVLKQIQGLDAVVTGTAQISHKYDPRLPTVETAPPIAIGGDTRAGNLYAVELMTPSLATVVRHSANEEFELHALSYLFSDCGSV